MIRFFSRNRRQKSGVRDQGSGSRVRMASKVKSYKDLIVWKKAIEMVLEIYKIVSIFPSEERYALTSQIRRSAVSVPSNIAEGHSRQHSSEFRQFIYIALGSLAELDTQLIIAEKLQYIREEELVLITERIVELRKMLFTIGKKLC
jgi:four helix bundle protein